MIRLRRSTTAPFWISALAIALCSALSLAGNTALQAPPRFDGAGYAMLAKALATGQGYRDIALPQPTRHTHFPPGYPAALALVWKMTGTSVAAAHLFSCACTVTATILAWLWFRWLYPRTVTFVLGLALAVNWTWGRTGGAILSEPMFLMLGQLALLVSVHAGRRGGAAHGVMLGAILAGCVLTRHVGIGLAAALGLDLLLRRRWSTVVAAGLTSAALLLPWAGWLAVAGSPTQVSLLALNQASFGGRVAALALFYLQRLPDQLTGPIVEVGTVFQNRPLVTAAVNAWAVLATGLLAIGLVRTLRCRRRRSVGLTVFATLAVLLVWPFTEAGRFLIPLVPCLLVGAAEGLAVMAAFLKVRRPRIAAAGVLLALSLPYATYSIVAARADAQRRTFRDFDAACTWIAGHVTRPGPILARHPADVFWQTGRRSLSPSSDEPELIDDLIDHFEVAYILTDDDRYAQAPTSSLSRYVARRPERVRKVWNSGSSTAPVVVYECTRGHDTND
jgi:hypothetical protein